MMSLSIDRRALARRSSVAGCAVLLIDLIALPVYADDYATRFDPRVEVGGLYDDNYRLTPGSRDNIDVTGAVVDAQLTTRFRSPTSELTLTPRVRSRSFPGDSNEDDTAEFFTVEYRSDGETTSFGGNARCSREAVTSSERPVAEVRMPMLGNAPGVDAGFTSTRSTQRLCELAPRFSFDVTNTSRIELNAQYLNVNYTNEGANSPTDFDSVGATLGFSNDLNAVNTLDTRIIASRFDPGGSDPQSNTYGAQFEWQRRTSNTFESYLRLGIERVNTDSTSAMKDSKSNDYVLGAGLRRDFQITKLFVDLNRSVAPNSVGQLVTRNQARVRLKREFSQTISGIASVLGIDDSDTESDQRFRDRRYVVGTVGFEWRWSRSFSLTGEYGYTRQKYQNDRDAAKSNQVSLSVVYEPNRLLP